MNVVVTHPGTQYSFRLAAELHRRRALAGFYTGFAFTEGGWFDKVTSLLPREWQRRLANRRLENVPPSRLHTRALIEFNARWKERRGDDSQAVWHQRAASFQYSIPEKVIQSATAVIGFDTAGWILANRCARVGVPFVLDQSIGHPDAKPALYELAAQQYPRWSCGIEQRRNEVRAAEQQEHETASRIVAASSFTRRTLIDNNVAAEKIALNPYGVDCCRFHVRELKHKGPLRFLFAGLINARKGVPLLLEAWQNLRPPNAELWLVGGASRNAIELIPNLPGLKYWGRVPHREVVRLMQQCDVFVLPSYFEGFGLVLLEAMACGLPIMTTTATAGPDIITEGVDGWNFTPGDLVRLEELMTLCLENAAQLVEMGRQARVKAEKFTWNAYGDRWLNILRQLLPTVSAQSESRVF